ncbi:MAG: glycosyltransferase family 2 protein [Pseudomonadota bacterium]
MSRKEFKSSPRISVIIPAFNKAETICRAIYSAVNQEHKPEELIVIDDGSTDDTAKRAAEALRYAQSQGIVAKLITQENSGVSAARNAGIRCASTEYVALLDGDDEWLPNHILITAKLIKNNSDASLYFTGFKLCRMGIFKVPKFGVKSGHDGYLSNFFLASRIGKTSNSSNSCIKKSAFIALGGFPVGVIAGEDLYTWIMLALNGKVACTSEISSIVHHGPEHLSGKRLAIVPYPVLYFSQKCKILEDNPELKRLLITIAYKHYLFSVLKGSPNGAWVRWCSLLGVAPVIATILLPALLFSVLLLPRSRTTA